MQRFYKILLLLAITDVFGLTTANGEWLLEQQKQAANGSGCFIKSSIITMNDGYHDIAVHVEYDGHDLVLVTPSNIDNSFSDMRTLVDRKNPAIQGVVLGQNHVRFPDSDGLLARRAIKGRYLYAYARFWPTWPATKAQLARFSLKGFTRAHKALINCR
jgi:hypothetical protein